MTNHPIFTDNDPQKETITLNLGPTHPATHGVFQNVLEMDGERIVSGVSILMMHYISIFQGIYAVYFLSGFPHSTALVNVWLALECHTI